MTKKEIHDLWTFVQGKSEGVTESGGDADVPVMFAEKLIELYNLKLKTNEKR